jgi:hypothetical protein
MLRSTVSKVMWVGRATVLLVGLAVILAAVLGVATAALAGTGVGAAFNLGRLNTVNQISRLVGKTDAPMLRVDNNATGTSATALDLQVEPGHAPMKVNSSTQVAGLNADKLDGVDSAALIRWASIYERTLNTNGGAGPDETATAALECDHADTILSGGFTNMDNGTHLIGSWTGRGTGGSHFVQWQNNATVDTIEIIVKCADTTP